MKRILLIGTGGTIASELTESGLTPELSSEQLLSRIPSRLEFCRVDCVQLLNLDSTNIVPRHWLAMARCIRESYDDYDGFVLTHGTDTMAYTAAGLSYLIQGSPKPIVLTGAQKPIGFDSTDSKINLEDAFRVASAEMPGVSIVFNGKIILGTRAQKTHSKSFQAFSSINYPVLGVLRDGVLLPYIRQPALTRPRFYDALDPKVGLLKLTPGCDRRDNFNVYLNGAVIVTNDDCPSIANLPEVGRVKVVAVKDTVNAVINKYNGEGTADHDAIKSENNLPIEVKNESILYVTSVLGDGVDGGETTFTDSKGAFIVSGCGERGVKGNAVVIGPSAQIDASVITSYITDPGNPEYTTFDGIFVAKGNVTKEGNIVGNADTSSEEAAKASGYADVYGRNGKCTKGVFGTTNTELKGIAIIGSLTAHNNVDTGNAQNLHVNQILKAAANAVETVQEAYVAVPYEGDPIV